MKYRRIELIAGLLSGVLGVAGLALVLFGPVYEYTAYMSNGVVHGSEGLLVTPHGFLLLPPPTVYIMPIIVALVPPLVLLIGAMLHSSQGESRVGLVLLVGATVALLLAVIFNPIQLLQFFMLPSLLLALVACAIAVRMGRSVSPAAAGQEHS